MSRLTSKTKVTTIQHKDSGTIKEAIDNIVDKNLSEMKTNIFKSLFEKTEFALEEKKKQIASEILPE